MANFDDVTLFGNTSLSDIFKQIHRNNKDTDKQINELIAKLNSSINQENFSESEKIIKNILNLLK